MQCRRQAYAAVLLAIPAAAQAVHDYFGGKVLYINVMNNLSVDCNCDGNPSKPQMADLCILASTLSRSTRRVSISSSTTTTPPATPPCRSRSASTTATARGRWNMVSRSDWERRLTISLTSTTRLPSTRLSATRVHRYIMYIPSTASASFRWPRP